MHQRHPANCTAMRKLKWFRSRTPCGSPIIWRRLPVQVSTREVQITERDVAVLQKIQRLLKPVQHAMRQDGEGHESAGPSRPRAWDCKWIPRRRRRSGSAKPLLRQGSKPHRACCKAQRRREESSQELRRELLFTPVSDRTIFLERTPALPNLGNTPKPYSTLVRVRIVSKNRTSTVHFDFRRPTFYLSPVKRRSIVPALPDSV